MKHLKWFLLLPAAAFPYVYFVGTRFAPTDIWNLIWLVWLVCLVASALACWKRNHWTARELALANMLIKLIHIPAYVLWFGVGLATFLFLGPVIAFIMDAMAIVVSGLVGLAAVLRCRTEGKLGREAAIGHGILQFIFCADVFSAVWVYINSRKEKERFS